MANLVNYFGKTANVESIEVSPLLLQKGTTRLALYGLGSCRDERLHRMMRRKNVTFLRPEGEGEGEGEEGADEWFSLLVLHQNRYNHCCGRGRKMFQFFCGLATKISLCIIRKTILICYVIQIFETSHKNLYYVVHPSGELFPGKCLSFGCT